LRHEVTYIKEHEGAYSFFRTLKTARHYTGEEQIILKCEVKDVTYSCKWNNPKDSFLAKEVVSFEEIK
jgi:hypothetical protein